MIRHLNNGLIIFLLLLYFLTKHIVGTDNGICPNENKKLRCCAGFYLKGSLCVACPNGTYGKNCSGTCPTEYYGRNCANKCSCKVNEICSPVKGCVNLLCNQRDCINGTLYHIEKQNENDETGNLSSTILPVVLTCIVIIIIVLIVGIFLGAYRRSNSKSILSFLRGNLNLRTSENTTCKMRDNEKTKDEALYDDIRESKMLNFGGTMSERYQDVKFLTLKHRSEDAIHYGHCDVGHNDVYNKLSLRGAVNVQQSPYSAINV